MEMDRYSSFVDHDDYFENNDDRQVKIINGTYVEYFDSSFDGDDKSKTKDCLKYLEEFNKLNKFKSIKIDNAS